MNRRARSFWRTHSCPGPSILARRRPCRAHWGPYLRQPVGLGFEYVARFFQGIRPTIVITRVTATILGSCSIIPGTLPAFGSRLTLPHSWAQGSKPGSTQGEPLGPAAFVHKCRASPVRKIASRRPPFRKALAGSLVPASHVVNNRRFRVKLQTTWQRSGARKD